MKAILRRLIFALIGATMMAASAGVMVVALGMALYAVMRPFLGDAGAAAGVVLAAAILMAVVGVVLERSIRRPLRKPRAGEEEDLVQKLIGMAQDKPLIAAGALIGAIFLAIRNPALTAAVVKAFLDPKPRPGKKA